MTRTCMKVGLLAGVVLISSACSGGEVDIGDEANSTAGNGSKLSKFAGSWDGQIDLWQADSGSNRVRIELDAEGQGSVRFGDLPIQSASDHPYANDQSFPNSDLPSNDPIETAIYPVHEPVVDAGTLEFFVELGDLFDAFCAAQVNVTPKCDNPDLVGVRQDTPDECILKLRDPDDNYSEVEVPCPRAYICYRFRSCVCSEDACEAIDFQQIHFRMESEGGGMSGDARFTSEPVYYEIDFD